MIEEMCWPLPITLIFFAMLLLSSMSSAADLSINVKGKVFSAHVEDFSLQAVAEEIESKTGIWFKSGGALPEERISVDFEGLPFEDGLERILSKMNYSLVFDDEDEIVGVFLLRSLDPRQKQIISRAKARTQARIAPRPVRNRRAIPIRRPQPFRN
jgi:hypothetical protein